MSKETLHYSKKANILVAAGGAGSILVSLLTGCSSGPTSEETSSTPTTYTMPSTATETNPTTPTTPTAIALHGGIGLCRLLPTDSYPKVTGDHYCTAEPHGDPTGAVSGNAHIRASAITYNPDLPCPGKELEADGTGMVCFERDDPSGWSVWAWSKTGENVSIWGTSYPPSMADAHEVGRGILQNLAAEQ